MDVLAEDLQRNREELEALARGVNPDPFAVLGIHQSAAGRVVRTLQPGASKVELIAASGRRLATMRQVHPDGIFTAVMPPRLRRYRLRLNYPDGASRDVDDPYQFPPTRPDSIVDGDQVRLGSTVMSLQGTIGTRFAVWAPNAHRVSVVGNWNGWDGRINVMWRNDATGTWELFIPQVGPGALYKYEILDRGVQLLPLKSDPYAQYAEIPPGTASIVFQSDYCWQDDEWMHRRPAQSSLDAPLSIYEVHPGSWRRKGEWGEGCYTYRDLAKELVDYVQNMGFTHLEFLPVTEHPYEGSWGYQPIGMFAASSRFGSPDDFRYLVDCCHRAGIGVIVDWVPAHFPRDDNGLRNFDGTTLYEHNDPRRAEHLDWGTLIFDYGRREVVEYLVGSAQFWIEDMHVDGLRVDAVASMLYLDYSRKGADWLPNEQGGNENHDAVVFLKSLNEVVHASGGTTFAEESTTWPGVSRPVYSGGLGFTYKWNLGWMHDTLGYMSEDPIHRKYHHDKLTFGLVYAFEENFVLPLSHDEVVHGKRSLLGRMPGDDWQKFANLRAYLAMQYCHPGKKLLFMGAEFAQQNEWSHERSLDWHLLDLPLHAGVQKLIRDLNGVYRNTRALYEMDFDEAGFTWLVADDREQSVYAWMRRSSDGGQVICAANFTPMVRRDYAIRIPAANTYHEILNTDATRYGGGGIENSGTLHAVNNPATGPELQLTLPPLALIVLAPGARN